MRSARLYCCCLATLCFVFASAAEKQIKLEDIEKDTLKAAQQSKYEKQIQQQQAQRLQYQEAAYQYDPQVYAQQSLAYQTPASYSQYLIPQQYIPQTILSGYSPLTSNSLSAGYAVPSASAFQTYLGSPLTLPSVSSFHASQPIAAATQTQPIIMTFTAPALTAFQHQPYYQAGGFQYYPSQTTQATQFYYTPHATDQTSTSQIPSSAVFPSSQQYLTSYQPATTTKSASSYSQQYISTAPQTFPAQSFSGQTEYTSIYTPQTYSSNSVYSSNTEMPTFVTVKAPQHLVASQGQQQQYAQAHPTTISPLQVKYLNSPQYLAQNYNTIQSSQLYSKGTLSSGVKSTVNPPLKTQPSSSFSSNNFASTSNSASSYQPFRSLPPKSF